MTRFIDYMILTLSYRFGSRLCNRNTLSIDRELTYNKIKQQSCNVIAIMRNKTPTHPFVYENLYADRNEELKKCDQDCKQRFKDFNYQKNKYLDGQSLGDYDNLEDAKQEQKKNLNSFLKISKIFFGYFSFLKACVELTSVVCKGITLIEIPLNNIFQLRDGALKETDVPVNLMGFDIISQKTWTISADAGLFVIYHNYL